MNKMNLISKVLLLFLAMFFFLSGIRSQEIDGSGQAPDEEVMARFMFFLYGENLEYIVCNNKTEYFPGEPVFVKYSIKTGEDDSRFSTFVLGGKPGELEEKLFWLTRRFQLIGHTEDVNKTELGKYSIITEFDRGHVIVTRMYHYSEIGAGEIVNGVYSVKTEDNDLQMKPKEEMSRIPFSLNQFFDISRSGEYFFSCTQYAAQTGRILNPPQKSNTISFRIKSGPSFRSSGLKEPGTWVGVTEKLFERFNDLPPSGDYSKLKYVLRSNKTQYKEAEPVFLRLFLKNESDDAINICVGGDPCWTAQSWSLVYRIDEVLASTLQYIDQVGTDPAISGALWSFFDRHNQIQREGPRPKLRLGQLRFPDVPRDAAEVDWVFERPSFVKLGPGEEVEMEPGEIQLNLYYDVSSPGTYVLKCQRSTVIPGQKFDSPLESNEVEFEIVRGSHFTPSDLVDPGRFDNPPEIQKP